MTCIEKYMMDHPDTWYIYDVVRNECPSDHSYLDKPEYCQPYEEDSRCIRCWSREIPETPETIYCDSYDFDVDRCNGTKNREHCSCKGLMKNCDFYPEYRERAKIREEQALMKKTLFIGDEKVEHPDTDTPQILDSGNRREFETGAVRDIQEGKGRCDLMPLDVVARFVEYPLNINVVIESISEFQNSGDTEYLYKALDFFSYEIGANKQNVCLEVSKHFEEGAKKYGEHNWQKGMPTNCYIDSAVRHYLKFLRGDTDEPHDRAFVWNLLCCIWTCKHKPELNVYRKEETC